ncbi:major allergen pru ar 1 [Phtheirospermum japonicum]|uniref:Major allergen pru ar 1 n=1 Tax=Phtheirospermum japonicum TaxID=374723 RepID=A0A830BN51_9LAMI|nr:major allergen pru ar 1 [Phtheirospermum japonicum]
MFKAMVTESHTLLPKIIPNAIKSIDLLHGDVGVGAIWQTNLPDGAPVPCAKHRIDGLDTEKGTSKYTMIEGGWLGDKIESIVYDVKFEEVGDGGCLIKITSEYHTKGDAILKDDDIKESIDHTKGFYIAADEYLIANPDVCA